MAATATTGPDLKAASAALVDAIQKRDAVLAEVTRLSALVDSRVERTESVDPADVWDAKARLPELQATAAGAERAVIVAERAVAAARVEQKAQQTAAFAARKRQALKAHAADVVRARESALRLQALQAAEHEAVGPYVDPLWFAWLTGEGSRTGAPRSAATGFPTC